MSMFNEMEMLRVISTLRNHPEGVRSVDLAASSAVLTAMVKEGIIKADVQGSTLYPVGDYSSWYGL